MWWLVLVIAAMVVASVVVLVAVMLAGQVSASEREELAEAEQKWREWQALQAKAAQESGRRFR